MMPRQFWQLIEECEEFAAGGISRTRSPAARLYGVPRLITGGDAFGAGFENLKQALLKPPHGVDRVGLGGGTRRQRTHFAASAVRDDRVLAAYDSVLWLRLGPRPEIMDLQTRLADSVGARLSLLGPERGRLRLRRHLAGGRTLLVLDDVYRVRDVERLDVITSGRVLLVSGELEPLRRCAAELIELEDEAAPSPEETELSPRDWHSAAPSLAVLGDRESFPRGTLESSWDGAVLGNGERAAVAIESLLRLGALSVDDQDRFRLELDPGAATVEGHRRWVEAWRVSEGEPLSSGLPASPGLPASSGRAESELDLFRHAIRHLIGANEADEARRLVLDARWLTASIQAAGVDAVIADLDRLIGGVPFLGPGRVTPEESEPGGSSGKPAEDVLPLLLLRQALWQASEVLEEEPEQVVGQILGRLHGARDPLLRRLLEGLRQAGATASSALELGLEPALKPQGPLLDRPVPAWIGNLEGHSSMVFSVDTCPDGSLVTTGDDKTVRLWDPAGRSCVQILRVQWPPSKALALPNGDIAIGDENGTLHFWRPGENKRPGEDEIYDRFDGHGKGIFQLRLMADGERLLSAAKDGFVVLWSLESRRPIAKIQVAEAWVFDALEVPGDRIAAASADEFVRIYDAASGRPLVEWPMADSIRCLALSPDGDLIAGGWGQALEILPLDPGGRRRKIPMWDSAESLLVLPDGRLLTGMQGPTICQWSLHERKATGDEERVFYRHGTRVVDLASLGGDLLASGSWDGTVGLWDLGYRRTDAFEALEKIPANLAALAYVGAGRALVAGTDDVLRLWDLSAGRTLRKVADGCFYCLTVVAGHAYGGGEDGTVRRWSTDSWSEQVLVSSGELLVESVVVLARDAEGAGPELAVAYSGEEQIWLMDSEGEELGLLPGCGWPVDRLLPLPGGLLAAAGEGREILVWNVMERRVVHRLEGHGGEISGLVFGGGGALFSSSVDGTVRRWDLGTGEGEILVSGHSSELFHLGALGSFHFAVADGRQVTVYEVVSAEPEREGAVDHGEARRGRALASFTLDDDIRGLECPNDSLILVGDEMHRVGLLRFVGSQRK